MIKFLIFMVIRLAVSYIIMRIIYSWILTLRAPVLKDKMQSVEAKRIKYHRNMADFEDLQKGIRDTHVAVYEYYVNGIKYTSKLYSGAAINPFNDSHKTLYYRNNPKNVVDKGDIKTENQEKRNLFIIAICYAVFMTFMTRIVFPFTMLVLSEGYYLLPLYHLADYLSS